jgi:hypothetical protein
MELIFNDLSLHGQFADASSVASALRDVMAMQRIASKFGRKVQCRRGMGQALTIGQQELRASIHGLNQPEKMALLAWMQNVGPFWSDASVHTPDDWLEHNGEIVTETGLGEAAWKVLSLMDSRVVSIQPSKWQSSPIVVDHVSNTYARQTAQVTNYFESSELERALQAVPLPLASWGQLESVIRERCTSLSIATDTFASFRAMPFSKAAADRFAVLFGALNRLKECYDGQGNRTSEGHRLYQDFFTGKKGGGGRGAPFSDSSDAEKAQMRERLTFSHPDRPGEYLFCPWHGKTQTPQYRVHFSWPMNSTEPTYVVYAGPKLTV